MNKFEFVKLIKEVVSDAAIEDTIQNLSDPPGRKPDERLLANSKWFHSLSEDDRKILLEVITDAVQESVFGFLCVLDGVRSTSPPGEANQLELFHKKLLLNDSVGEFLHDIYKNV